MSLSNATNSARDLVFVHQERLVAVVVMTFTERQVVLALEALAHQVDVQLRVVLRVVVGKELQVPLCLLVDLLLGGARRACLGRMPV